MDSKKFTTVDEYFTSVPDNSKTLLLQLRNTIRKAAPKAEELISYNMPAFKLHGILVYYVQTKITLVFIQPDHP